MNRIISPNAGKSHVMYHGSAQEFRNLECLLFFIDYENILPERDDQQAVRAGNP